LVKKQDNFVPILEQNITSSPLENVVFTLDRLFGIGIFTRGDVRNGDKRFFSEALVFFVNNEQKINIFNTVAAEQCIFTWGNSISE
jgi:hypothetical protein